MNLTANTETSPLANDPLHQNTITPSSNNHLEATIPCQMKVAKILATQINKQLVTRQSFPNKVLNRPKKDCKEQ